MGVVTLIMGVACFVGGLLSEVSREDLSGEERTGREENEQEQR